MSRPINPVLWLELKLRFRFRSPKFWIVSALFVAVMWIFSRATVTLSHSGTGGGQAEVFLVGVEAFLLLGLTILVGATSGAGRISQEREQRTLAGLLNTPLSAARIAWGKLLGVWAYAGWFLLLALPFFLVVGLAYPDLWKRIALSLAVCAGGAMTVGAIGLGFSGYFRRTLAGTLATGLFLLLWMAALPLLCGVHYAQLKLHNPGQPVLSETANALFLYHNPLVVLGAALVGNDSDVNVFAHALWPWLFALAVWAALIALGFWAAVRSLRRGLFDRS